MAAFELELEAVVDQMAFDDQYSADTITRSASRNQRHYLLNRYKDRIDRIGLVYFLH